MTRNEKHDWDEISYNEGKRWRKCRKCGLWKTTVGSRASYSVDQKFI